MTIIVIFSFTSSPLAYCPQSLTLLRYHLTVPSFHVCYVLSVHVDVFVYMCGCAHGWRPMVDVESLPSILSRLVSSLT